MVNDQHEPTSAVVATGPLQKGPRARPAGGGVVHGGPIFDNLAGGPASSLLRRTVSLSKPAPSVTSEVTLCERSSYSAACARAAPWEYATTMRRAAWVPSWRIRRRTVSTISAHDVRSCPAARWGIRRWVCVHGAVGPRAVVGLAALPGAVGRMGTSRTGQRAWCSSA